MPIDEDFRLRAGDVVTLTGTVRYDDAEGAGHLSLDVGSGSVHYVSRSVCDLVSTHIAVGDEVGDFPTTATKGVVLAVLDGRAWVRWATCSESITGVGKLRRLRTAAELVSERLTAAENSDRAVA